MATYSKLNLFKNLNKTIKKHKLLISNSVSCMVLLALGDGVTQAIESSSTTAATLTTTVSDAAKHATSSALLAATSNSLAATNAIHNSHSLLKLNDNNNTTTTTTSTINNNNNDDTKFNWIRNLKMLMMGTAIGPLTHAWYTYLDGKFPKKTRSIIIRKLIMDQAIFAPFLNIFLIAGIHLMDGNSLKDLKKAFDEKFLTLYTCDCALWTPAQALNFYFVSPQYRVLYVNVVTLFWNTISSYIIFNESTENGLNMN